MTAVDPQEAFTKMLSSINGGQKAMDLINQYGNGDPKTAFMNYAASQGKQQLANTIMSNLGLK